MKCVLCTESESTQIEVVYEYPVCKHCYSKIRLFSDHTIEKHIRDYSLRKNQDPDQPDYAEDIKNRLEFIERDFIRKKIKLLHLLERTEAISNK